jgi:nucleotidyltransferase/DNA polymerase involved in DNA repair
MLKRTPIAKVWGIGPASAAKLQSKGVATAYDFTRMDEAAVLHLLHKPGHETWCELQGRRVFPLDLEAKRNYDSMMKGHTFSPPSDDARLVFSEALQNMTHAMAKLRRHAHLAREIGLSLRLKDYTGQTARTPLASPTSHDCEAAPLLRSLFDALYTPGQLYRSTLVWFGGLVSERNRQLDLFEETPTRHDYGKLDAAVDRLNRRYGQNAVAPAALLDRRLKPYHSRDAAPERYDTLLQGETIRHLAIPRMTLSNPV